MNLNALNLSINHISGCFIPLTDFSSRNPVECIDKSCQLCQFVTEHLDIAVSGISVEKIIDGSLKMPFYNFSAWKEAQKQDPALTRTYSQLLSGTRPGKKEKNIKLVRHYLQVASISQHGVLIRRKSNIYGRDYEQIIVPQNLAPGLITVLHLRLGHPTKTQFKKLWDRYFFAIHADELIDDRVKSCSLCASLKKLPNELLPQSTSHMPDTIGEMFSADVLRREKQMILVLLDKFSSFIFGMFILSEKHDVLREALIQLGTPFMHSQGCTIKVDNAPGFQALKNDELLQSVGIKIDFARVKNKNGNPTADKAIQELEGEIKRIVPEGGPISPGTLATAIRNTNCRIRMNGLSAREVILKRDNFSNDPINFADEDLKTYKYDKRVQNHHYSELSKSQGANYETDVFFNTGDIVHIKTDGTKHCARDFYLITSINYDTEEVILQKFYGTQLRSRKYNVKLSNIYLAPISKTKNRNDDHDEVTDDDFLDDDDGTDDDNASRDYQHEHVPPDDVPLRRSKRVRKPPDRLDW